MEIKIKNIKNANKKIDKVFSGLNDEVTNQVKGLINELGSLNTDEVTILDTDINDLWQSGYVSSQMLQKVGLNLLTTGKGYEHVEDPSENDNYSVTSIFIEFMNNYFVIEGILSDTVDYGVEFFSRFEITKFKNETEFTNFIKEYLTTDGNVFKNELVPMNENRSIIKSFGSDIERNDNVKHQGMFNFKNLQDLKTMKQDDNMLTKLFKVID